MSVVLNFSSLLPFAGDLANGLAYTCKITLAGTILGVVLGTLCAMARYAKSRLGAAIIIPYVELIRNTPFIVQLFFIFFGLPALGWRLDETTAAVLAMVINLGAYSTEIIRAGMEAVAKGQTEAGMSLGLSRLKIQALLILPQAFGKIWPALSSQIVIVMLGSSVVSQISAEDLTYVTTLIQSRTFRAFEVFFTATLIYLALTLIVRFLLRRLGVFLFPAQSVGR